MSSARDVKRGCSVSVLYTGHLKEPGAPLESGRFLYPARTPTNTSHGAESTITTLGWVGKNDGDSGWGFGGLHGWFLTDLLSRAARGWMRVLVSRVFSGWVLGPGPYAGAGGGGGGSGSLGVGALVRGRRVLRSGNCNDIQPFTTDRRPSTSRDPEHMGVALSYTSPTLENGPEADETNSTPETEEMSDNRSPDLSFENEADGLLVESSASLLDVSLRLHDYGRFTPVPAIIRHQCEQVQPELISVVTQTDDTRVPRSISTQTSTETSTVGIQVDRPSFTFEDIRDDDDKVLFYTGIPTAGTFECLFDEVSVGMKAGILRGDMRLSEKGSVASLILEDAQGK
ncbi:hypothetical protein DPMN_154861 [Dreissena polymorpha]|uniref:Uncharacterized protein n=2 Tax=Dreissena polymorpha TaxID=45954 RepID=A0A9D4J9I4_DREPO|nr:hypothetical protein DPMN_154861 [Dreissena polymorpha]